MSGRFHYTSRV